MWQKVAVYFVMRNLTSAHKEISYVDTPLCYYLALSEATARICQGKEWVLFSDTCTLCFVTLMKAVTTRLKAGQIR